MFIAFATISWQPDVDQPIHEIMSFGAVKIFNATESSPSRLRMYKVNALDGMGGLWPVVLSCPRLSEREPA